MDRKRVKRLYRNWKEINMASTSFEKEDGLLVGCKNEEAVGRNSEVRIPSFSISKT
jgi:hypothetical protein